eukprot:sb/3477558/
MTTIIQLKLEWTESLRPQNCACHPVLILLMDIDPDIKKTRCILKLVKSDPIEFFYRSLFTSCGWEKICDKLISSLTCPNGSPLALLSFFKLGISDQRPRISGGRCWN